MGGKLSRKKKKNKNNIQQIHTDLSELSTIFPNWDANALNDVLITCGGDKNLAIQTVISWSNSDHNGPSRDFNRDADANANATTSLTTTEILIPPNVIREQRLPYDKFMRAHLLKHETPKTQQITLKAATLLIARAHLAKKIVAMRKAQINCMSEVALPPPMLRSFSEEERDMNEMKRQMSREEKIEDGVHLLQQRADFLNLRIIHMEDDGNCQFRALSHEIYGHQKYHDTVRNNCVNYLIENTEKFSFFVGDSNDFVSLICIFEPQHKLISTRTYLLFCSVFLCFSVFFFLFSTCFGPSFTLQQSDSISEKNNYIQKMSITRTWGDELTLRAAAEYYQVTIHVTTTEKENW